MAMPVYYTGLIYKDIYMEDSIGLVYAPALWYVGLS